MDLTQICSASADPSFIQDTRLAQPLVFIAGLAAAEMMRRKHPVDFSKITVCAGFSLGELTALCFAGAISFEDSLRLVKVRANAMAKCDGGGMCNVRGLDRKETQALCKKFGCQIANIICDHDAKDSIERNIYVCAGNVDVIDELVKHVNSKRDSERGIGGSCKRIRVSAAFHTKQMKPAQAAVRRLLKEIKITLPENYLINSNVTGQPYRSADDIRCLLVTQIISCVQWHASIKDMQNIEKVDRFVECGPMATLSTILRSIDPQLADEDVLCSDGEK